LLASTCVGDRQCHGRIPWKPKQAKEAKAVRLPSVGTGFTGFTALGTSQPEKSQRRARGRGPSGVSCVAWSVDDAVTIATAGDVRDASG
jgi:hypothetical protein